MIRHVAFAATYFVAMLVVANYAFRDNDERGPLLAVVSDENAKVERIDDDRLTLLDLKGSWKCVGMTPTSPPAKNECGVWEFDGGAIRIILERPATAALDLIKGRIVQESEQLFRITARDVNGEELHRKCTIQPVGPYLYVRLNLAGKDFAEVDNSSTTFVLRRIQAGLAE